MKAVAQLLNEMCSGGVIQNYALFGAVIQQLLKRQADWQKTRQTLSWPDKIQMAERIRASVRQMRTARNTNQVDLPGTEDRDQQKPRP